MHHVNVPTTLEDATYWIDRMNDEARVFAAGCDYYAMRGGRSDIDDDFLDDDLAALLLTFRALDLRFEAMS